MADDAGRSLLSVKLQGNSVVESCTLLHAKGASCADTAPKTPAPARPLSAYTGSYNNEYFGTLEVSVQGDRLILRLPPRGSYYELTHWDGDIFTYYFASENTGQGRRGAVFSPEKNQVLIQNLVPEHNAVFTRAQPPQ